MNQKPVHLDIGEIAVFFVAYVIICACVLVSDAQKKDPSTRTLSGKIMFMVIAAVAMVIGVGLGSLNHHHRDYSLHYTPDTTEADKPDPPSVIASRLRESRRQKDAAHRLSVGDEVVLHCGSSVCVVAASEQAERELSSEKAAKLLHIGQAYKVKSGTKAVFAGMGDGAEHAYILIGTTAEDAKQGWVPDKWLQVP